MNYQDSLDFLYKQLPMYQRVGAAAMKKDLGNIKKLCKSLDDPQKSYMKIHIAGTNGKGTVAHMLASVFQTSGYKVGLYTSPHYKDFRERIKIDGDYIDKQSVVSFCNKIVKELGFIKPSFFEITVAMAFQYFKEEQVDIAIIETGLGGRLDSTNIIDPMLSIITNISLDHQSMLGNTLNKIAREKAGIIKKNVPVVIGEKQKETSAVFLANAKKKKSKLYFAEDLVEDKLLTTYSSDTANPYLRLNQQTALAGLKIWNEYHPKERIIQKSIREGIKNFEKVTNYIGRWMILNKSPLVIADSAHNKAGLEKLFSANIFSHKTLHIVVGFVKDKDIDTSVALLPKDAQYYFCKANIARGLDAKILKEKAATIGLKGRAYVSVANAFRAAKRRQSKKEVVLVCGSIFVVSEVL